MNKHDYNFKVSFMCKDSPKKKHDSNLVSFMCKDSPKPSSVGRQAPAVGRWGADLTTGRRMVDALGDNPAPPSEAQSSIAVMLAGPQ